MTKEERREYDKAWRLANPDKVKATRARNRKSNNASKKKWRKANPEKQRASVDKWARENPDKMRAYSRRHREKKLGRGLKWTYTKETFNLGTFEERLTDAGDHYTLKIGSSFGLQEARFDKDLLPVVVSADSVRIFNSAKTNGGTQKLYVQLIWLHKENTSSVGRKIKRSLYLHRVAMGIEDAGRAIHAHHTDRAIDTCDCRREVLEVLTASEHAKRTHAERKARGEKPLWAYRNPQAYELSKPDKETE